MNDTLKAILDKMVELNPDQMLAFASEDMQDAQVAEIMERIRSVSVDDYRTLMKETAKAWNIDIDTLSGGSGSSAEEDAEEDASKLYEILIKGLQEGASKIKGTLALKNVIKTDPNWTLSYVKSGVDNLATKPFVVPVAYQKADPELEAKLKEIRDSGFNADISEIKTKE